MGLKGIKAEVGGSSHSIDETYRPELGTMGLRGAHFVGVMSEEMTEAAAARSRPERAVKSWPRTGFFLEP